MTRIVLILMAVLGLNAADIPAKVGDQLAAIGGPIGTVATAATGALGDLASGAATTGMSASSVSQASIVRMPNYKTKAQPLNVAKVSVSKRRSSGLGGISF